MKENDKQTSVLLLDIEKDESVLDEQTENDTTRYLPNEKGHMAEDLINEKMQASENISNMIPKETQTISDTSLNVKCPKCGSPAVKSRKLISEYHSRVQQNNIFIFSKKIFPFPWNLVNSFLSWDNLSVLLSYN